MNNNTSNGNERIAVLENKHREIAEKLAAARALQRKNEARLHQKICLAVGQAVVQVAAQNEGFLRMLKQTLDSAVADEKTRKLLAGRGLL